jgi:hypothetical protein
VLQYFNHKSNQNVTINGTLKDKSSFGMLLHVVSKMGIKISEKPATSTFKAEKWNTKTSSSFNT